MGQKKSSMDLVRTHPAFPIIMDRFAIAINPLLEEIEYLQSELNAYKKIEAERYSNDDFKISVEELTKAFIKAEHYFSKKELKKLIEDATGKAGLKLKDLKKNKDRVMVLHHLDKAIMIKAKEQAMELNNGI